MSLETIEKETEQVAERRRRFVSNPEEFYHQSEIIFAAVKTDNGIGILTGAVSRPEMEAALTRLNYRTFSLFTQMDMAALIKKSESEIVLPPESGKIIV